MVAVGVVAGLFPLPGVALIVAHALGRWCNGDAFVIGTAAVLATPMQLALIPTFIDAGAAFVRRRDSRTNSNSNANSATPFERDAASSCRSRRASARSSRRRGARSAGR